MNGIVKTEDDRYVKYEALLLKRDALRKEAGALRDLYIHEFGELMTAVYQKNIECISLKRQIALCQEAENHCVCMLEDRLNEFMDKQMADYNARLKELIEENERCMEISYSTEAEAMKAKALYRKLAKLIHPDIHPKTETVPELTELWNRVCMAYAGNNVKELEELEVMVGLTLEQFGLNGPLPELPDIDEKIEAVNVEIERIETTEPYLYKLLFDDVEATGERRREYEEELETYTEYAAKLQEVLAGFRERGVLING